MSENQDPQKTLMTKTDIKLIALRQVMDALFCLSRTSQEQVLSAARDLLPPLPRNDDIPF
jgi:hypothetical protein